MLWIGAIVGLVLGTTLGFTLCALLTVGSGDYDDDLTFAYDASKAYRLGFDAGVKAGKRELA